MSGCRPTQTTAAEGFKVSSGRPVGTGVASGYSAGVGGGRPSGTEAQRQDRRSDKVQPGSPQYWKSFGLDLIAMTQTWGLPDFFVTLSVNDAWPHVQATIRDG